ncbi:Proteinase inhibitor I25, cystatin, conserved region [Trema orientale]|uniref:Cysteine proteinase inhibitor n=1 Tax=Trema orientale TaxID=63057 RepID=A0A2P5EH06_TREOI|nr:Proteinase inhibitor I25, cystatin, conserved region [Trema orientale]
MDSPPKFRFPKYYYASPPPQYNPYVELPEGVKLIPEFRFKNYYGVMFRGTSTARVVGLFNYDDMVAIKGSRMNPFPRAFDEERHKRIIARSSEFAKTYEGFYVGHWDYRQFPPNYYGISFVHLPSYEAEVAAGTRLKLVEIVRANVKHVFGLVYYITLKASDECFYEAKVFCKRYDCEVLLFRPARHYESWKKLEDFRIKCKGQGGSNSKAEHTYGGVSVGEASSGLKAPPRAYVSSRQRRPKLYEIKSASNNKLCDIKSASTHKGVNVGKASNEFKAPPRAYGVIYSLSMGVNVGEASSGIKAPPRAYVSSHQRRPKLYEIKSASIKKLCDIKSALTHKGVNVDEASSGLTAPPLPAYVNPNVKSASTHKLCDIKSASTHKGFNTGEDSSGQRSRFYGTRPVQLTSLKARAAAKFALEEHNKKEGTDLKLRRILSANMNYTSGCILCLTLKASNKCFYEAKVLCSGRGGSKFRVLFFTSLEAKPQMNRRLQIIPSRFQGHGAVMFRCSRQLKAIKR